MTEKIIITGSSGFVGRWVIAQLRSEGYRVIGLDKAMPDPSIVMDEHIACNILDRERLISEVRRVAPDALIHLAARVDLDETKDINGYADNIDGVRNVVEAVRQTPGIRRAIYTSSQLVCRVGYVPRSDSDYCPNTLYGQSKVLTENIVREMDGGGAEWCLVRPTTVWGPHMSAHYQGLLKYIRSGRYFHVGNSKLYKSYGYAGNTAYQYSRLLQADAGAMNRKTFYMSDYQPLSLREYADGLALAMGAAPIPSFPHMLARLLALAGDAINGAGFRRFPFNSFRLNNILTEYVFDMSGTEAVCGPLPYTQAEGIARTAEWFMAMSDVHPKG